MKDKSDIIFGAVVLNPVFSLFNIKMQGTSVNTSIPVPAHRENLVMIISVSSISCTSRSSLDGFRDR